MKEQDRSSIKTTTTTRFEFAIRRPDTVYRDTWLWLPKTEISVNAQKASLEFPLQRNTTLRLWREAPHHLGVPRELVSQDQLGDLKFVDLTPKFKTALFNSNIELDCLDPSKRTQHAAFNALTAARCGVLNLACGGGKTVIMIHAIAHWSTPTLIIANQEEILEQWRGEIEASLNFEGGIGWIQGSPARWDWKRPIVLGMIRSLAKYASDVPIEMRHHFGVVVWDECHHLSASEFCKTADLFPGRRYGVTATVERGDGSEHIYLWHIGPVIYSDLSQDLMPEVTFLTSPSSVDVRDFGVRAAVCDRNGAVHVKRLSAYVGCMDEEINFVTKHLEDALLHGRKILALSTSKQQLEILHGRFPESGLITGDIKGADIRRSALRDNQLCFGTTDLAKEALNDRALDTLFILTEFVKEGMLQQSVGRIQRILEGKPDPKVVVMYHKHVEKLRRMASKMISYFMNKQFRVRLV